MKKFINYNYKYDSQYFHRAKLIKEMGFDGVFIYSQYKPDKYINDILSCNLEIETLHLPYKLIIDDKCVDPQFVNVLWTHKPEAEKYMETLVTEINFANDYGIKNVVLHITGGKQPPPIDMIGADRVKCLIEYCEKYNMNLCLENLRCLDYIKYLYTNINSDHLKFCFDSGHANYMTKNINDFPWESFGDKLACVHLNDNDGTIDCHGIPFSGNIEWNKIIKKILKYNPNINLTLEVRASKDQIKTVTEKDFLKLCYESLLEIEKLKEK